jgi:hypothetical protein
MTIWKGAGWLAHSEIPRALDHLVIDALDQEGAGDE